MSSRIWLWFSALAFTSYDLGLLLELSKISFLICKMEPVRINTKWKALSPVHGAK